MPKDPHDLDPPQLNSHIMDLSFSSPSLEYDHAWPIPLKKGIRSTHIIICFLYIPFLFFSCPPLLLESVFISCIIRFLLFPYLADYNYSE